MGASVFEILSISLIVLWLVSCAYTDIKWRKITNSLTLGAYLPALLVLIMMQQTLLGASVSAGLLAWLVALVLTLPAYAVNWLGAGDVKMLSVFGLMTGLQFMLSSYAVTGILAGLIVVCSLLGRRYIPYLNLQLSKLGWQLPAAAMINGKSLPFGALLAVGGLLLLALHLTGIVNVVAVA